MKYIFTLILSLMCIASVYAEQRQPVANHNGWEWVKVNENEEFWYLHVQGVKQGAVWPNLPPTANYLPIVNGFWSQHKIACPWPLPRLSMPTDSGIPPGGVEPSKIHSERVTINGREVNNAISYQQLPNQPALTDDSWKAHVTFVSEDEAKRKAVTQQWENDPKLKQFRETCHFLALPLTTPKGPNIHSRLFRPDVDPKFQKTGAAFYVQGPAGQDGRSEPRVIYGYDVQQLPDQVSRALRDIDPKYDPTKPKDMTAPSKGLDGISQTIGQWIEWAKKNPLVVIMGAVVIFLVYNQYFKKESK